MLIGRGLLEQLVLQALVPVAVVFPNFARGSGESRSFREFRKE